MQHKKQQTVDVALVAANFNNGPYLRAFIESVCHSGKLPEQLIIVDDGSTDNSRDILKEYETLPGACFICSEKNEGFANALNKGIAAAKTGYIMRADPDDLLHPLRTGKQLDFLLQHPEYSGVGCNVEYFHAVTGKTLHRSNFPVGAAAVKKAFLAGEHGLQHPAVMVRTEVFRQFLYRQEHVPAEDYDIFARLIDAGHQFCNLKDVLYSMRIHPTSASSNISYETVRKTYALRKEIFGITTPVWKQRLYYFHILGYRRYLLERNIVKKSAWLLLSGLCYPSKLIRRLRTQK